MVGAVLPSYITEAEAGKQVAVFTSCLSFIVNSVKMECAFSVLTTSARHSTLYVFMMVLLATEVEFFISCAYAHRRPSITNQPSFVEFHPNELQ